MISQNIRTRLSEWTDKTFGKLHPPEDTLVIREELKWTKPNEQGIKDWIQTIILEIKKSEGFQKSWVDEDINKAWKEEIKEIAGDHMKLVINSSLGKENSQVSGYLINKEGNRENVEQSGIIFNYQFKIELRKRIRIKEEKNGTFRIN